MFPILYSIVNYISYTLFQLVVLLIKCYIALYMLSSCHETLEDHREGTINARSKSANLIISTLMLSLTVIGLYGVFISHFGLFLTWLLLKPVILIFELESPSWSTLAMFVIASGSTLSYLTYESFTH